ncbi:MAG: transcription antitermination protein NusB [Bacteroidales bacterium]|nr:transcription antitermination protein NusB [Bacteroidales bacterium]MDE7465587.1 transcription antitermination protein NusB [Muribaculaceae bacterium]
MINRVLIRRKVIQTLYSYLLVEKQFTFESRPTAPTKEKRFAYALYIDMLMMLERISHKIRRRGGDEPLANTRFIKRILTDDQLKGYVAKYNKEGYPYETVANDIAEEIKNSSYYKNWLKQEEAGLNKGNATVWRDLFEIFIANNPRLAELYTKRDNFTLKGVERAKELLDQTFANFMASQDDTRLADRALQESLDRARELYFRLLLLPVQLTDLQERKLEQNREKYLATHEDLNPNMRFVENQMVEELRKSETFRNYVEKEKLSWLPEDELMLERLLQEITSSEIYKDYMEAPVTDLKRDCTFWQEIFKRVIFHSDVFLETLEDKSVFWNDDLDIIGSFVLKTIRRIEEGEHHIILDKFKDEEDARFGSELIQAVLRNKEVYRNDIDNVLHKERWDRERLAFMDVVILETALAEILNFPKIPLQVSVNEYVEIAKSYSTARSGSFVHGLLASILQYLKEEGRLMK